MRSIRIHPSGRYRSQSRLKSAGYFIFNFLWDDAHVPAMLWCEFLASKLCLIIWTKTNSVWLHDCCYLCLLQTEQQLDRALDLMRRLPPQQIEKNLSDLIDLVSAVLFSWPDSLIQVRDTVWWFFLKRNWRKNHIVSVNGSLSLLQKSQPLLWSVLVFLKSLCSCLHLCYVIWGGHKEMIVSCCVNEKYCRLKPMMHATFFWLRALVV